VYSVAVNTVYSNQVPGEVANYLPGNAGGGSGYNSTDPNGKQYILMGVRPDDIAYARADVDVVGTAPSDLVFELMETGTGFSAGPDSGPAVPAPSGSGTVLLKSAPVTGSNVVSYYVGYGLDANGDGQLQASEILDWAPYQMKVVDQTTRDGAISRLTVDEGLAIAGVLYVNEFVASNWLYAFLHDVGLEDAINVEGSISTADTNLSHHVGAIFHGQTGPVNLAEFGPTSLVADEILNSAELKQTVSALIKPDLQTILVQGTDINGHFIPPYVKTVSNQTIVFNDNVDLARSIHGANIDSLTISDVITSDGSIESARVSGIISDTYDFDYDDGGIARLGAIVQAGYNQQGDAGHVFKEKIAFSGVVILG
jgi:hypothetical protein